MVQRRFSLFAAVVLVAATLAFGAWSLIRDREPALALDGARIDAGPAAPNVVLVDQHGQPFDPARERGRVLVLFFGYAHCPDICPTTLAKVARAYRSLGTSAHDVTVAFVTVDPKRDTSAALAKYVALFDPHFLGVTGTPQALETMYRTYHVWHQELPNNGSAAGYLVAHSSSIYFLDQAGRLRTVHDWTDAPATLAHDMKALVTAS